MSFFNFSTFFDPSCHPFVFLTGLNRKSQKMTSEKYTPQEIARLILLASQGKAEPEQMDRLEDWLEEGEANRRFYEKIKSRAYWGSGLEEYTKYNSREDWKKLSGRVKNRRKNVFLRLLPYAAVAVLAVGIAGVVKYKKEVSDSRPVAQAEPIAPGASKARLILADGRNIELETEGDSLCRQLQGENFVNDGKELAYAGNALQQDIQEHTLQIPRGGEYKLVLADGTRVWLNAESELTYPNAFPGDSRQVKLKGEAYFEVAKNPDQPFRVMIGDMEVKVLGTSFNVSAYPEAKRQTTLVEGKVAIAWNRQQVEIAPGQQATETSGGLEVKRVKVANYVGWKERRFIYEDKLLGEVLEDLERWYDVEMFIVNNEIRNLHLTANLPKYENMDKVLEIIEYAACVKFGVKGRTVVVSLDR